MAPKPGSTYQPQVPAQGGKGGAAGPNVVQPTIQPTQPQSPYTPIGAQGGKSSSAPVQPTQPQVPAQGGKSGGAAVNPNIPAQGGKAPLTPEQQAAIMAQAQPTTTQPVYPTVGTTLPGGIPVTQEGVDQAKLMNASKGVAPVINTAAQAIPKAITPVTQAVTRSVPTPAQIMSPAQRRAGLAGLAGLRGRR